MMMNRVLPLLALLAYLPFRALAASTQGDCPTIDLNSGCTGDDCGNQLWWLGALIYMGGSICINFGSNVVRLSHEKLKKIPAHQQPPIYKRYLWMTGFLIFFSGNIFNFVGFMFGAQSLLVALGSVQFVSNLLFARFINKENITRRSVIATCAIVLGNVFIVVFGSKDDNTYGLEGLKCLVTTNIPFIIYFCFKIVCTICMQALYMFINRKIMKSPSTTPDGFAKFVPFAFAAVSTMIGSTSVGIGKSESGIVLVQFSGQETPLYTPWPWLMFACFLCLVAFWLYRLNKALKQYDALFIIPVMQALWLFFGVIGGGLFFEEFTSMKTLNLCFFTVGMIILLCGVLTLSPASFPSTEVEEDITGGVTRIASIRDFKSHPEYTRVDSGPKVTVVRQPSISV
mmetsp:Transcript_2215/g.3936  ORF Transcript_2215/g.3936 Transcript_2215/m.3936 type:complete len:399 (-) Transcript_2215:322-1518(-)